MSTTVRTTSVQLPTTSTVMASQKPVMRVSPLTADSQGGLHKSTSQLHDTGKIGFPSNVEICCSRSFYYFLCFSIKLSTGFFRNHESDVLKVLKCVRPGSLVNKYTSCLCWDSPTGIFYGSKQGWGL